MKGLGNWCFSIALIPSVLKCSLKRLGSGGFFFLFLGKKKKRIHHNNNIVWLETRQVPAINRDKN